MISWLGHAAKAAVPEFPTGTGHYLVAENAPAGQVIGAVTAQDADGHTLTYSLLTSGSPFALDANTGVLSLNGVLDRIQAVYHDLEVSASDGTQSSTTTLRVFVIKAADAGTRGGWNNPYGRA